MLQRLVAKALAARGEHIEREVALSRQQVRLTKERVRSASHRDAMARAIEQPGFVVDSTSPV